MFLNHNLVVGDSKSQLPHYSTQVGVIAGFSCEKKDGFNEISFRASLNVDHEQAVRILKTLTCKINNPVYVWSQLNQEEYFFQGVLVKVESYSDLPNNKLIDQVMIKIQDPIC